MAKQPTKLLLIEDNPGDARLIREMLADSGYPFRLTTVDDLAAGLAQLKETRPDLVLLDLSLPDSHGLETFTRAQSHAPELPIIVLTGLNDETVALRAVQAGAQDYLVKGEFEEQFLARAIRYGLERSRAEEAVRRTERRYKALIENAPDGVVMIGTDGKFKFASPSALRMFGYSAGDLDDLDPNELTHPEDLPRVLDLLDRITNRNLEDTPTIEYRFATKTGDWCWIESTFSNLISEAGVEAIVINFRNITGRKQAEQTLRESETFLQSTLDSLSAHIAILDEAGVIVAVNAAWRHFAEANQLQMDNYGLGANYLDICDEASGESSAGAGEAAAGIRRALANPQADFYLEYPCHSPEEERWFAMRVTHFKNNGKVVVAHENITRRKQAEKALKAQSEQLAEMVEARTVALRQTQAELVRQEKMATLGHLAASVSHELRNPLGVIKNAAYFLKMSLVPTQAEEVQEALTILEIEVDKSEQIIRSLLDFGQVRPPVRQTVDLNQLVEEAIRQTANPGATGINISYQHNGGPAQVVADPDQLRQVFGNLILNALQAMSPPYAPETGTRALAIESANPTPAWVTVAFRDTGVGIAPEELDRIFEPLFTTKAKGIGLGLALAKSLVEAHGGEIRVESKPALGSTFIVHLPTGIDEPTAQEPDSGEQ